MLQPFVKTLQDWVLNNKQLILIAGIGLICVLSGILIFTSGLLNPVKVEVLGIQSSPTVSSKIVVEIAGEVIKPGVYEFEGEGRVDELLVRAGGISSNANRDWVVKNLNRAAKLVDGQKIYIPKEGEANSSSFTNTTNQSPESGEIVNINTAGLTQLDKLSGIGQVRAQAIIDNRPYSNLEELVSKKVLPKSIFEKIKDRISL